MAEAKVRTFRTDKHEGLALWNGEQKIKFIRGAFSTSDADTISCLKKKIKSAPHFCIKEIKPGDEVVVITKDDQQQAAVERRALEAKILDLETKLGWGEQVITPAPTPKVVEEVESKIETLQKAEVVLSPQQKAANTRKANLAKTKK